MNDNLQNVSPPEVLQPATPEQLIEALAWAVGSGTPLELLAGGSKRGLGRPVAARHRLDLSGFAGVSLYEADELVMSAGPATPLREIEAMLGEQRQQLAFEPMDLGPLLGLSAGCGSIGGAFACNLSGPRRIKAGAARDHLLGVKAVSGRAERFKTGGRVVKNVTGYDLCKLLCGSYGTLAALTEVTFKVLPAAPKTRTLLLFGLDDAAAVAALTRAATSAHDAGGLAHLPATLAARSAVPYVAAAGAAVTAIRLEGPAPSVEARLAALRELFKDVAGQEELHGHHSATLWRELRDAHCFLGGGGMADAGPVWRLSVPPSAGARVVQRLRAAGLEDARWYFDWAGGLIWLGLDEAPRAEAVRAALAPDGGHATLIRASAEQRATIPVFQPQSPAVAALSARLRQSFDPGGILNPGRMAANF